MAQSNHVQRGHQRLCWRGNIQRLVLQIWLNVVWYYLMLTKLWLNFQYQQVLFVITYKNPAGSLVEMLTEMRGGGSNTRKYPSKKY